MRYSPAIKYFDFPLTIGKKWSSTSMETDKKTGKIRQHITNGEVLDNVKIEVPAGNFDTIKIKLENQLIDGDKRSTGSDISWYAPSISRTVKTELVGIDADGHRDSKIIKLISLTKK